MHAFASLDELLASLEARTPYTSVDSLSGSHFEAVQFQGEPMILKYVCVDNDWIMRATGDLDCRQLTLLESGLLDRLPAEIDSPTVGVAPYRSARGHRGAAILMRDVGAAMIPPGSAAIDMDARRLYFHDASFEVALLGQLLAYMSNPVAVLDEARRLLRPGGRIVISCQCRSLCTPAQALFFERLDRLALRLPRGPEHHSLLGEPWVLTEMLQTPGLLAFTTSKWARGNGGREVGAGSN